VRYALGALKGVGEKAMEQLVAEREAKGPFKSLEDFAARIDPRLLNRRQLEGLAAAGSFDALNDDRASIHAGAETILRHAQSAASERQSGQAALFGGAGDADNELAEIRLPTAEWTLAERMGAERDAFGFYFSSHPIDAQRHLLTAHRVKTFAELGSLPMPAEGGRTQTMMAGLVEEARWRTSQKGRRYMMCTLSDPSGQFSAMAFDDAATAALEEAAKSGEPGLVTAELDRRPGEEEPRVAVKMFRPLSQLSESQRLKLDIHIPGAAGLAIVQSTLERGGRGIVRLHVPIADGRTAVMLIGRDFQLDADIADRLSRLLGEPNVMLAADIPERPRLVHSAAG
ncbi:MAG: DUF655 domain-containing protein, partial [Sphingomonadaceae bacterium]